MRLSRRQLLSGNTSEQQDHIASLVVQCLPEKLEATCAAIAALDSTEIPLREDTGKFVVLLEVSSEARLLQSISQIENISGVISANLVYHQVDTDDTQTVT